jgi:predicted DNA-binding antitoxin AbrB/MazE fold protein
MSHEVGATYANGVLKLDQPLPLAENQRVKVTVHIEGGRVKRHYGLLRWTGDPKVLEEIAAEPDFGISEPA